MRWPLSLSEGRRRTGHSPLNFSEAEDWGDAAVGNRLKGDMVRRLNLTDSDGWGDGPSYSGEWVNERTVLALSAVWACVQLLAGTIASLPLMVYRTGPDGSRRVAKDHPLYRLLHDSPNFDQTAIDFWESGVAGVELRGNMHARKKRIGDRLVALEPIYAAVDARRAPSGEIRYRWSENGKGFDEAQADVLHIRGFGGTPLSGLSTLAHGRNTFGLASAEQRTAGQMFANGLRPAGILTFEKWLSPEQRGLAETALVEKYAGAMNAGRPMVLEGGTAWTGLTINPEDAQMLESRGFSVEEVCRFFGVPPFMVGHTEKTTSWGTGLEQQVLGFIKFTLRRRLKRIEQALEQQLLTAADRTAGIVIEFNLEGLLRGDSKGRAEFYASGLDKGWLNVNQVCAWENLPPVPGGDVNRVALNTAPLTEANAPPKPGDAANDAA